jgi:predicted MFS family arabinose efflux permease
MVYGLLTIAVPLWQDMNAELGFTYPQLNDSYGVSAATLSIGCVMFTPFALRFGRRPIYILTSVLMFATNIWSAEMKSLGDLMGTNVVLGLAGSVNEALYQMTVSVDDRNMIPVNNKSNRFPTYSLYIREGH